jgi:uncharacterized membrane protein
LAKAYEIEKYEIYFSILENLEVKEEISIIFRGELNETILNYLVVGDVSNLRINSLEKELDYELKKTENKYQIKIYVPSKTKQILISFITKDLIFARENNYQFFSSFDPPENTKEIDIKISLPRGYVVYTEQIFPSEVNKTTDGEKIYLSWTFRDRDEEIPISVKFYNPYEQRYKDNKLILLIFIVPMIFLIYTIFFYRKKMKEEFLKGFSEDEIKVIEFLMNKKISYQNRIEKEFKFSRAKMTRIIKKLEGKKLVEKERIGRTNKIFWKK